MPQNGAQGDGRNQYGYPRIGDDKRITGDEYRCEAFQNIARQRYDAGKVSCDTPHICSADIATTESTDILFDE